MTPRPFVPKLKVKKDQPSPCEGCPYEKRVCKTVPVIPESPALVVVGDAPDQAGEFDRVPFAGPTFDMIASALRSAGYDVDKLAFLNLTRCRAADDDLRRAAHAAAEKRCRKWLEPDLAKLTAPLLLLGERAFQAFWRGSGRKPLVGAYRGLWMEDKAGRKCFVVRHPRDILTGRSPEAGERELRADVGRMAASMSGTPARMKQQVYESPVDAESFLRWLAGYGGPWVFDIESFDAVEFPSRKFVSTDPCHPDFRLRGLAVAWAPDEGAYVDTKEWNDAERKAVARELLAPAFASDSEKGAFSGHFDEEGLVYTGFVPLVRNRAWDGMLAMVALGDGTHDSLRLEKAVVDVLGHEQYWEQGFDKSKMRDAELVTVADGAIRDACYTFELCTLLHERIAREDYLIWGASS